MITFDAEHHKYTDGGVNIPSVTTILGAVGLPDLSTIPAATLQWKAELGAMTHLATELDDQNELDYDSLDDRIVPYLEAYRRFKRESKFIPILSEVMVFSKKYWYAGTYDRSGILNGKEVVIDLKTGMCDPKVVGPQLAAYVEAGELKKFNRYSLKLNNNGTYRLTNLTNKNDLNIFLYALQIYNWKLL